MLSGAFRQAKHPTVAAFHIAFKTAALFVYMFGSWFSSNDVFLFVIIILLLACDFWTVHNVLTSSCLASLKCLDRFKVKNVSGRLLVGLRWWNCVKDDGKNEWIFESLDDMSKIGAMDSRIFWSGLYVTPVIWIVFLFACVFKFQFEWVVMCAVAITLSWANIYGYTQCRCASQIHLLFHLLICSYRSVRKQKAKYYKQETQWHNSQLLLLWPPVLEVVTHFRQASSLHWLALPLALP